MASRYVVGIDLGTTHTVMAYADTEKSGHSVEVFAVDQLVAPGETAAMPLLPSFLYLPGEHELPEGATRLAWAEPPYVVGELARSQGARVPGRLVASAKSWLTHPAVDREGPILPWGAPAEVPRVSPVEASARYLEHLRRAWNQRFPAAPLEEQEVVLTVPASFDELARELTVRAAQKAGLPKFVLLEEPQAAFYDFIAHHPRDLASVLDGVRLILVVDVGGGTTDLTLIHAGPGEKGSDVKLTRLAVGDHLMLGGDNMDLALARTAEDRLVGVGKLDAAQWSLLVQSARAAKEKLLSAGGPESVRLSVVGRGSRLVGGTLSTELTRAEAHEKLIEGFFPHVASDAQPIKSARAGIQELGLPYASDPAISRHLAGFLRRHAGSVAEALGVPLQPLFRPDAILLNGGVFNAPVLQERLLAVMNAWFPAAPPLRVLQHESLDLAVARGASGFGRVRRGEGLRIGGGSARAYYAVVEDAAGGSTGLCVVARKQEEGAEVELGERTFALVLNRPVRFALFTSTADSNHRPGDVVALGDEAQALPPIETVLTAPGGQTGQIPVRLVSRLSEVGTLELALRSVSERPAQKDLRWKLEFQLRGQARAEGATKVEPLPPRFAEGRELVELVFGKKPLPVGPRDVKDLFRNLERTLGPREGWSTAVCRELWSELYAGLSRRRRTEDHERLWSQLAGYTLRPGFGHPLDAWRVAETWKAYAGGVQFHAEKANWAEWWILWRRIAGGLDDSAQLELFGALLPHLRPLAPGAKPVKLKGVQPEGPEEMLRLAASLERVTSSDKQKLGEVVLGRLRAGERSPTLAWSLGRLGARQPLYGSAHTVVPPLVAEGWLEAVLAFDWQTVEGAPFAATQLARVTEDRARDLDPALRERAAVKLASQSVPEAWVRAVREGMAMEGAEKARAFGESLPAGLKLLD